MGSLTNVFQRNALRIPHAFTVSSCFLSPGMDIREEGEVAICPFTQEKSQAPGALTT